MAFEIIELVTLYKDKEIIKVNTSDVGAYKAKGYVTTKPAANTPPPKDDKSPQGAGGNTPAK